MQQHGSMLVITQCSMDFINAPKVQARGLSTSDFNMEIVRESGWEKITVEIAAPMDSVLFLW